MAEINAMIEIRHNNDPRNRVMRTLNARSFSLDGCTDMIRIDDILAMTPDREPEAKGVMMEVDQLRDLLGQLGYSLIESEDAQEIIQRYNEDEDVPRRCLQCGHEMESAEGWRCAGYVCRKCGYEEGDNTYD